MACLPLWGDDPIIGGRHQSAGVGGTVGELDRFFRPDRIHIARSCRVLWHRRLRDRAALAFGSDVGERCRRRRCRRACSRSSRDILACACAGPYFVMLTFGLVAIRQVRGDRDRDRAPDRRPSDHRRAADRDHLLAVSRNGHCRHRAARRHPIFPFRLRPAGHPARTKSPQKRLGSRPSNTRSWRSPSRRSFPGLVGGIMLMRSGYLEPDTIFDPTVSLTMICIAVIGGGNTPATALLGSLFLVGLSETLWVRFPLRLHDPARMPADHVRAGGAARLARPARPR